MPVKTKAEVRKIKARELKVRTNVRKTFPQEEDLLALANSVRKAQIHPLIVFPPNFIGDGECRWRGMMLIDPDFEFDVILVDRELSAAEVMELQMVSALHSTTLGQYDQAVAIKEWLDANPAGTAKQLGERIDISQGWLSQLSSLWSCVPAVIEAARLGKISAKAWYPLSRLSAEDQPGVLEMHLAGLPAGQIAGILKAKRKDAAAAAAKVGRIRCAVPGRAATVVVTGDCLSLEDMIEALADLLRLAKKESEKGLDAKTFERVCKDLALARKPD